MKLIAISSRVPPHSTCVQMYTLKLSSATDRCKEITKICHTILIKTLAKYCPLMKLTAYRKYYIVYNDLALHRASSTAKQ